jgi:tetraacyldisaccharide 4'-kinase
VIALARLLREQGFRVDVLSRGYGRQSHQPARVRPEGTAAEFGDEPLLIACEADVPVYVAPQRYDAGLLAETDTEAAGLRDDGSGLRLAAHILDDGFQHRQLARDVDVLMLNRADWHDSLLPAGNLREPLREFCRASAIAIPSDEQELEVALRARGWQGPIWRLHRRMNVPAISGPVAAFCGIARPKQFFAGIEAAGLRLVACTAFRDHHRYAASDVERLAASARAKGATALITTEKDRVRMGSLCATLPAELPLKTARLQIEIEDADAALDWLIGRLAPVPAPPRL